MNGITSMQRSSTSYADYGKFASGKKVNRAADGAAELAIIQKQETQTRSYKVGENNIRAPKDMVFGRPIRRRSQMRSGQVFRRRSSSISRAFQIL